LQNLQHTEESLILQYFYMKYPRFLIRLLKHFIYYTIACSIRCGLRYSWVWISQSLRCNRRMKKDMSFAWSTFYFETWIPGTNSHFSFLALNNKTQLEKSKSNITQRTLVLCKHYIIIIILYMYYVNIIIIIILICVFIRISICTSIREVYMIVWDCTNQPVHQSFHVFLCWDNRANAGLCIIGHDQSVCAIP
jgi:hypothetical protein